MLSLCFSTLVFSTIAIIAHAGPTATIRAGVLTGGICTNAPDAVYFKSIPFAQPPVGNLRFAPPQPYCHRYPNGHLNATQSAPSCIQFGSAFAEPPPNSEDCLFLDIWAPQNATKGSNLPVRVWLYGGSNQGGGISDATYDGCQVPSSNALMVSLNYRLGPLGFLTLEEAGIKGNQAIQDILLGLEWVQENIAAFGGDPRKVLLHGQSAGAIDSFIVATLPQAPRLMNAAIFQSGGGRDSPLQATAENTGKQFAQQLKCTSNLAACLRNKTTVEIQEAAYTLPILNTQTYGGLGFNTILTPSFEPHVDGSIIPYQPSEVGVQVPAIFGSNRLEGTLFVLAQFAKSANLTTAVNQSVYDTVLTQNLGSAGAKLVEQYLPISAYNSTPYPAFYAVADLITAFQYQCPAYRGLNVAAAKGIPVWTYQFDTTPKCDWYFIIPDAALPLLGATHTAEIPYVLGTTDMLPLSNGTCTMTPDQQNISEFMKNAWTYMAEARKPVSDPTLWPAYTGRNQSMGIVIVNSTTPAYVNYTICELFDKINDQFLAQAYNGTIIPDGQ